MNLFTVTQGVMPTVTQRDTEKSAENCGFCRGVTQSVTLSRVLGAVGVTLVTVSLVP